MPDQSVATWPFGGMTRNGYGGILVDRPSRFETRSRKGESRSPQKHYRTMTLSEFAALPVAGLAARHAWLFYWTSGPYLAQSFKILERWGFTYSSIAFTWTKLNRRADPAGPWTLRDFHRGTGYTSRKFTEVCLLARRGAPPVAAKPDELITAPIREHSRKPDEQYPRIEQLVGPGVPLCELFGRVTRAGWDSWGDEVGKFGEVK